MQTDAYVILFKMCIQVPFNVGYGFYFIMILTDANSIHYHKLDASKWGSSWYNGTVPYGDKTQPW